MGDRFTADLFAWLNRVGEDPVISAAGFKLAFLIGQRINRGSGEAWPSQQTLGAAVGAHKRHVRRLTDQLVERGHILVLAGQGRGHTNRYRLAHVEPNPTRKGDAQSPFNRQERGHAEPHSTPEKGTHTAPIAREKGTYRTRKGDAQSPQNHLIEPSKVDIPFVPPALDEFEVWWRAYPRRHNKGAAKRSYRTARRKADAAELLAGAERYAAERAGEDPKFTRMATTWLNGEAWLDEPSDPFRPIAPSPNRRGAMSAAQALIRSAMEAEEG